MLENVSTLSSKEYGDYIKNILGVYYIMKGEDRCKNTSV